MVPTIIIPESLRWVGNETTCKYVFCSQRNAQSMVSKINSLLDQPVVWFTERPAGVPVIKQHEKRMTRSNQKGGTWGLIHNHPKHQPIHQGRHLY